jgi:cob(I)alamin adenosyltransferase
MKTAKILNHPNLVRDMNTQAVLTTDRMLVRRHEKRVADLQKEEVREQDIAQLKNDISEIKVLLRQLSNSSIQN